MINSHSGNDGEERLTERLTVFETALHFPARLTQTSSSENAVSRLGETIFDNMVENVSL